MDYAYNRDNNYLMYSTVNYQYVLSKKFGADCQYEHYNGSFLSEMSL